MTKYSLSPSSKFKKDYKKFLNRKKYLNAIQETIRLLSENGHEAIPENKRPHKLIGNYLGFWEQDEELKEIVLLRVGSHAEFVLS